MTAAPGRLDAVVNSGLTGAVFPGHKALDGAARFTPVSAK
jgi:hypothetical protein